MLVGFRPGDRDVHATWGVIVRLTTHLWLALAAGLTIAADPSLAASDTDWTGPYLGINAGYGWGSSDVTTTPNDPNSQRVFLGQPNVPTLSMSITTKGGLAGIQAGYNFLIAPRWLAGIEADFDGANLRGSSSMPTTIVFGASSATFNADQTVEWFGTVRARLGYLATPDLLLYATGGLAYGRVKDSATVVIAPGQQNSVGNSGYAFACGGIYGSSTCFAGSESRTSLGWTAGAGGEHRLTKNLSLRLEYLHVDLGHANYSMIGYLPAGAGFNPSVLSVRSSATFDVIRAGLNYRF